MDEIVTNNTELSEEDLALLDEVLAEVHEESKEVLKPNSKTLLIDETSSRFSSATWFDEISRQTVTLAGLGGIGSYTAFLLGRLKVARLCLYDDDIVDATNLSGQLYSNEDVGYLKTQSTYEKIKNYCNHYSLITYDTKFGNTSPASDIMICGFDNMSARRLFFHRWRSHVNTLPREKRDNCLYIDGRLAAEEFQVFCIKGTDTYLMDKYDRKWLFDDSEAEETLCSYKQTSFCANMIASVMVNLFVNFVANKCKPLVERELPFYTSYDAERMYFKTEIV